MYRKQIKVQLLSKGGCNLSVYKRGKKYVAQVSEYGDDGKRRYKTKSFSLKHDAIDWENKLKNQLAGGLSLKKNQEPFADYFLHYFQTYKELSVSKDTRTKYMTSYKQIKKYFGTTPLSDIDKREYQNFLNNYADDGKKTHGKATVQKLHTHAHQAIREAVDEGIILRDFAANITIVGNPSKAGNLKYLEVDEFEKLINYLNSHISSLTPAQWCILHACYSGERFSEVIGHKFDDIDDKDEFIKVRRTWSHKNKSFGPTKTPSSIRDIYLAPDYYKHLLIYKRKQQQWLSNEANPNEFLFAKQDGTVPTNQDVNDELRLLLARLNIERDDFTFHGLRHTHTSYLLGNDVSLQYVSKRLGHDNIGVTMRVYSHLLNKYQKHEADKVGRIFDKIAQ